MRPAPPPECALFSRPERGCRDGSGALAPAREGQGQSPGGSGGCRREQSLFCNPATLGPAVARARSAPSPSERPSPADALTCSPRPPRRGSSSLCSWEGAPRAPRARRSMRAGAAAGGLAEGALPCTLGGGRRGREEGEREPPGEGTGWEGVPGAHPQRPLQPEAAEAPVTETHARQRPRARTLACTPACTLAHVRTPAQPWLLIRTLALE